MCSVYQKSVLVQSVCASKMAQEPAPEKSIDLSKVVLDLDEITNIGHPFWEFLDPNPSIQDLFDEFNQLFFDGILEFEVELDWSTSLKDHAGETHPAKSTQRGKISINLNEKILRNRIRREVIETLIHEMIHAYLIKTNKEDKERGKHFHGDNFKAKMNEIRGLTGLNITIAHDYIVNKNVMDYNWQCWRCTEDCRNMAPYFGFIWVREDQNSEPTQDDMMWIDKDKCDHKFEKYGDVDDPKKQLDHWDCIKIFNNFVLENKIRIKTKKHPRTYDLPVDTPVSETNTGGDEANSVTVSPPDSPELITPAVSAVSETNTGVDEANSVTVPPPDSSELITPALSAVSLSTSTENALIEDEHYVNFDRKLKKFVNVDNYLKVSTANSVQDDSHTVCMMCLGKISDDRAIVIEHLYNCTGLELTMDSEESLPIFKID